MTKRYFYTDPLAALWMAKHFGMHLVSSSDWGEPAPESCNWLKNGPSVMTETWKDLFAEWEERIADGEILRAFIRLDSVHLLEPQAGDIIAWRNPVAFDSEWQIALMGENPVHPDNEFRIVLRDNKAFHTPEAMDVPELDDGD